MKKMALAMALVLAVPTVGAWPVAARGEAGGNAAVAEYRQDLLEKPLKVLTEAAAARDPTIRANALEALQPLRDARATNLIADGLRDPTWIVRFSAAMAAGKRKQASLLPELKELFRTETNDNVRVALVYALQRLGDGAHMSLLAKTLASSDPAIRANTALVLGYLGDKSAIGLLKTREGETDIRVRLELTAALARLGDPSAEQAILAQSVSLYAEDHYFAIATCPDLKLPQINNVLLQGLKDNTPEGPLLAARALGKIGSNQGEPVALATLKKPDATPQQRALAALALGEIMRPGEAQPLVALLDSSDPHVAVAAAAGLVNIYARATAPTTADLYSER